MPEIIISLCIPCEHPVPCADRDVRLVESYVGSGRIEVCVNNSWGTICSDSWDDIDASVACKQAGYSPYGIIINVHGCHKLMSKSVRYEWVCTYEVYVGGWGEWMDEYKARWIEECFFFTNLRFFCHKWVTI